MIYLNIGSNLSSKEGGRKNNIIKAITYLKKLKLSLIKISSFYETPSYPNKNLPKFLNVGILVNFKSDQFKLHKIIKFIETKLGRIKTKKNDPRIIDIDIIDFKRLIKNTKTLTLPHPKCHLRNFVLYPIFQIDPNWSHPILNKNTQYLINNLSRKSRIEITRLNKNVNIQV